MISLHNIQGLCSYGTIQNGMCIDRPTISVVLPVYNAESTRADALESVRQQALVEHEVVLVMNGCTDRSALIARDAAAADKRIQVIELQEADLVSALNIGLAHAKAPLVARMDADDRMLPGRLGTHVAALSAHPEWSVVACGVRYVPDPRFQGGGMFRYVDWVNNLATPEEIRGARFVDAPVVHPSVAFRKDVVLAVGGYRQGQFPEDYDLWLRVLESGRLIGRTSGTELEWVDRPSRLTRVDPRCFPAAHRALRHRYLLRGPLAGGRRCRIWGTGPFGRLHARELAALGAQVDDFIDIDPRRIGKRVGKGLFVVGPDDLSGPDDRLILLCVGVPGARNLIEEALQRKGYQTERDYLALQ